MNDASDTKAVSSPKPRKKRTGNPVDHTTKNTRNGKRRKITPCSTVNFFADHPLQRPKWFIMKKRKPRCYNGDLVQLLGLDPKCKSAISWHNLKGIPRDFSYNNHHGVSAVIPGKNIHPLQSHLYPGTVAQFLKLRDCFFY